MRHEISKIIQPEIPDSLYYASKTIFFLMEKKGAKKCRSDKICKARCTRSRNLTPYYLATGGHIFQLLNIVILSYFYLPPLRKKIITTIIINTLKLY